MTWQAQLLGNKALDAAEQGMVRGKLARVSYRLKQLAFGTFGAGLGSARAQG